MKFGMATYFSPAIETDHADQASRSGAALFRVIAKGADGSYGRVCHYTDPSPSKALDMALEFAASYGRDALVERIDPAALSVTGAAFAPPAYRG